MPEKLVTAAAAPLFDLAAAKQHARVYFDRDDAYITGLIGAATSAIENFTRRAIAPQTWSFTFGSWCDPLTLGRGEMSSVSSIEYIDENDATQTLDLSNVWPSSDDDTGGTIHRKTDFSWPQLSSSHPYPIKVLAVVGVTDVNTLKDLVHAVKMTMSDMYEHRESTVISPSAIEIPNSAKALAYPHQVPLFR